MKLEEDKNKEKNYCGYYNEENSIYFDNGKLTASAYSYEIASVGDVELSEEQTKEVYRQMKRHFEKDLL